jgi:hypothetical protein
VDVEFDGGHVCSWRLAWLKMYILVHSLLIEAEAFRFVEVEICSIKVLVAGLAVEEDVRVINLPSSAARIAIKVAIKALLMSLMIELFYCWLNWNERERCR